MRNISREEGGRQLIPSDRLPQKVSMGFCDLTVSSTHIKYGNESLIWKLNLRKSGKVDITPSQRKQSEKIFIGCFSFLISFTTFIFQVAGRHLKSFGHL